MLVLGSELPVETLRWRITEPSPAGEDRVDGLALVVVQLSESFADLWGQLADDLGLELRVLSGEEPPALGAGIATVVLAAGGAERDALEWLDGHEMRGAVPFLVVGADPGRRIAAQLVGHGASDYFALPEDVEILRNAVASAVRRQRDASSRAPSVGAAPRPEAFARIIGESPALRAVLTRTVRLLPHAEATALIVGETGTGKELLARALHDGGPRHRAPFVPVNCSALPTHLIESELFGHERGAFTDAHAMKPGLFEVADGGTLFLDEIDTLQPDLQAKLLRVLDDKEVRRVGGTKSRRVDVRIMAATNQNLEEATASGTFRQDLFYRLSVVTLTLPPLRERGDDVILIAEALLERAGRAARSACAVPDPSGAAPATRVSLARQHPRTQECNRTCTAPLRTRRAAGARIDARSGAAVRGQRCLALSGQPGSDHCSGSARDAGDLRREPQPCGAEARHLAA